MTLAQIEAALSDAMPSDCDAINVSMSAGDSGLRPTVYLHWKGPKLRSVCCVGSGETLQAAYDAALIEKAELMANARRATADQYEREGCN